jgi:hypothetical protein
VSRPEPKRPTISSGSHSLQASKWLLQASPPDLSEGGQRWQFGVYEILDMRQGPFNPRVLHTMYRGVVELEAKELPPANDPGFSAKLEEAVVQKYKRSLLPG